MSRGHSGISLSMVFECVKKRFVKYQGGCKEAKDFYMKIDFNNVNTESKEKMTSFARV
jgi:hypothetical protein